MPIAQLWFKARGTGVCFCCVSQGIFHITASIFEMVNHETDKALMKKKTKTKAGNEGNNCDFCHCAGVYFSRIVSKIYVVSIGLTTQRGFQSLHFDHVKV